MTFPQVHNSYSVYPKYLDRQVWVNSLDSDQMLQNAVLDQVCTIYDSSSKFWASQQVK